MYGVKLIQSVLLRGAVPTVTDNAPLIGTRRPCALSFVHDDAAPPTLLRQRCAAKSWHIMAVKAGRFGPGDYHHYSWRFGPSEDERPKMPGPLPARLERPEFHRRLPHFGAPA